MKKQRQSKKAKRRRKAGHRRPAGNTSAPAARQPHGVALTTEGAAPEGADGNVVTLSAEEIFRVIRAVAAGEAPLPPWAGKRLHATDSPGAPKVATERAELPPTLFLDFVGVLYPPHGGVRVRERVAQQRAMLLCRALNHLRFVIVLIGPAATVSVEFARFQLPAPLALRVVGTAYGGAIPMEEWRRLPATEQIASYTQRHAMAGWVAAVAEGSAAGSQRHFHFADPARGLSAASLKTIARRLSLLSPEHRAIEALWDSYGPHEEPVDGPGPCPQESVAATVAAAAAAIPSPAAVAPPPVAGDDPAKWVVTLFLNFDGVLHPQGPLPTPQGRQAFDCAPALAQAIEGWPVEIVLHTPWAAVRGRYGATRALPPGLAVRVVDATYAPTTRTSESSTREPYERMRHHVEQHRLTRWAVLDWNLEGWPEAEYPHLGLTTPHEGITQDELVVLERFVAQQMRTATPDGSHDVEEARPALLFGHPLESSAPEGSDVRSESPPATAPSESVPAAGPRMELFQEVPFAAFVRQPQGWSADRDSHERNRSLAQRLKSLGRHRQLHVLPADWQTRLDRIQIDYPHFETFLEYVRSECILAASDDGVVDLEHVLLEGGPGTGKSTVVAHLDGIIGGGFTRIAMSAAEAGAYLGGSQEFWSNSRPGIVFTSLAEARYGNPLFLLDEIDKVSVDMRYDPLGPAYQLLEPALAKQFSDLSVLALPLDASRIIWIATANDTERIPLPIRQRFATFAIPNPTPAQSRAVIRSVLRALQKERPRLRRFRLEESALEALVGWAPREMRRAIRMACAAAASAGRDELVGEDFPQHIEEGRMGF